MFNVYAMNEFEREIAIAEKVYDIAMSEVAYMEAMIDSKLRINMAKSELKVMQESSEESCIGDLAYLFNEAAKEAAEQSQSTFAKIKKATIDFITSVWNSIQKVFTKHDTEAFKKLQASKGIYTAPCNIKFFADKAEAIDSALADTNNESMISKVLKIAAAVGITTGGIIGVKELHKRIKDESNKETPINGAEAVSIFEKIKNLNFFQKLLNMTSNTNSDTGNTANTKDDVGAAKCGIMQVLAGFAAKIVNFVTGLANKVKGGLTPNNDDNNPPTPNNGKNTPPVQQEKNKNKNKGGGNKEYNKRKNMSPEQQA